MILLLEGRDLARATASRMQALAGAPARYFYAGKGPRLYFVMQNDLTWQQEDLIMDWLPGEKVWHHLGGQRDAMDLYAFWPDFKFPLKVVEAVQERKAA